MSGLESLLLGRVLGGRYRIEEVIGRGGMGAVYRAVDERLGRRVAVKVITVAMGDDPDTRRRVRARFHREARAAAALPHHPNVVPVYDYGTDDDLGLDYIVMELLEGHDLATHLQRSGPPPLATALRVLREAARGLAVGHRAGLIHRDVKPGNIFLARDHDELQVRMVDFGIAKLADDEDTANQLTQDGRLPHSPAYASPEQLRGLTQLTPASDVFSLGAVGYQLLIGERPFTEADRNKMSLGMPVPPPSLRSRNEAIPVGAEEIIRKALSFDPVDRFPDAVTMTAALDRMLREIADVPIESFVPLTTAGIDGSEEDRPAVFDEDEKTVLMDLPPRADDEDERTQLMDLPAAAAPASEPVPPRPRPAPPEPVVKQPSVVPPRKQRTGAWVLALVLLAVAGAGVWAYVGQMGGGRSAAVVPDTLAVDSVPVDSAVTAPEPTAEEINANALAAFNAGRLSDARSLFERALRMEPGNAVFRQNVGIVLWRMGELDAARQELTRAISQNPGLSSAYGSLAQIQLAQGDTAGALASLGQYVDRAPPGRDRTLAEAQLRQLREERFLLGEPVDTPAPPEPDPSAAPRPPAPKDTTPR